MPGAMCLCLKLLAYACSYAFMLVVLRVCLWFCIYAGSDVFMPGAMRLCLELCVYAWRYVAFL